MAWLILALSSTAMAAVSSILQKSLLQYHFRSYFTVYIMAGLFQTAISLIIVAVVPGLASTPAWVIAAALALGAWNAFVSWAITKGMSMEDVSRVVPIIDSYPIFVVMLAVLFLGEAFTPVKGAAVGVIVVGAFLASWHQSLPGERIKLSRAFYVLILASAGIAVYNVTSKYLLDYASLWHLYALTFLGGAPIFVGVAARTGAWREAWRVVRRPGRIVALFTIMQSIGFTSFILWFYATNSGPVSLVSAVTSTRPVMVLGYVMLARLWVDVLRHRPLLLGSYRLQWAAVLLVTLGVLALALT